MPVRLPALIIPQVPACAVCSHIVPRLFQELLDCGSAALVWVSAPVFSTAAPISRAMTSEAVAAGEGTLQT